MEKKIKILLAKMGLDGHNRGAMVMAQAFRDAGMEVVYTGLHQTAEMVAEIAVQEDVDVIGVSMLSGAHMTYLPRVVELLKEKGVDDKIIVGGGCIDSADVPKLKELGVAELFTTGTPTTEAIEFIKTKMGVK